MTIIITPIEEKVSDKALKIARSLIESSLGGREWKYPIKAYKTYNEKLASEIAEVFDFYLGGSEFSVSETYDSIAHADVPIYSVSSLGYYHYIGA